MIAQKNLLPHNRGMMKLAFLGVGLLNNLQKFVSYSLRCATTAKPQKTFRSQNFRILLLEMRGEQLHYIAS